MGFVFAIVCSFFNAVVDALRKKLVQGSNEYIAFWGLVLFSLPVFLIAVFLTGWPEIGRNFYIVVPIGVVINIVASLMIFKALKVSPLSLTIPFLAFTPVFLILTSFLMLREIPNVYGLIGIILVTLGAYTLNISKAKEGFWEPIKAIKKERGSFYALIVSFIFSIGANIDKIAIKNSSPTAYPLVFYLTILIVMSLIIFSRFKIKDIISATRNNFKLYIAAGVFLGLAIIFQLLSVARILVAYTISIKRAGFIFAVIFGYLFFKEKEFGSRFLGAIVMVIGVLLITLLG